MVEDTPNEMMDRALNDLDDLAQEIGEDEQIMASAGTLVALVGLKVADYYGVIDDPGSFIEAALATIQSA